MVHAWARGCPILDQFGPISVKKQETWPNVDQLWRRLANIGWVCPGGQPKRIGGDGKTLGTGGGKGFPARPDVLSATHKTAGASSEPLFLQEQASPPDCAGAWAALSFVAGGLD